MKQLQDLMLQTIEKGVDQFNTRTQHTCRALVGHQVQFDTSESFPLATGKFVPFKSMRGELFGFFRGYDNAADFRNLGCKIWDQNANEDGVDTNGNIVQNAWLRNPNRKGTDDLGRIYGVQWTHWRALRVIKGEATLDRMLADGWKMRMYGMMPVKDNVVDVNDYEYLVEKEINQLENALKTIITNPSDRRIIVSAWNIGEFDMMALPPCHIDYRFTPMEDTKTLHCTMTIR